MEQAQQQQRQLRERADRGVRALEPVGTAAEDQGLGPAADRTVQRASKNLAGGRRVNPLRSQFCAPRRDIP